MENISVLIVEDKLLIAEGISVILEKHGLTVMGIHTTGEAALEAIREKRPDLILMDIELAGKLDGISTMEAVHKLMPVPVIYLSDYVDAQTVERAKKTLPANYLSKPFNELELIRAIDIAFTNAHATLSAPVIADRHILIRTDTQRYVKVAREDIVYLEAARAYCKLVTTTGSYTVSTSMNHVLEQLQSADFIRVHRKYTINTNRITEVNGNVIKMGKHEVQVSREYRELLMSRLNIIK